MLTFAKRSIERTNQKLIKKLITHRGWLGMSWGRGYKDGKKTCLSMSFSAILTFDPCKYLYIQK
jgi:hypothetical protein